ncbi:uncharacterized protein GJ701_006841 [Geothlypis trichas]
MAGGRAGPAAPEEGTEAAGGLYGGGGGSVAGQCGTLRAGAGGDGGRRGTAPRPAGGAGGPRSAARAPAAGRGAGAGGGGSAPRSGGGEGARPPPGSPRPARAPPPARGRRRSSRRAGEGRGGARSRLPAAGVRAGALPLRPGARVLRAGQGQSGGPGTVGWDRPSMAAPPGPASPAAVSGARLPRDSSLRAAAGVPGPVPSNSDAGGACGLQSPRPRRPHTSHGSARASSPVSGQGHAEFGTAPSF